MKRLASILLLIACLVIIPSQAQAQDTIPADSIGTVCIYMALPMPDFPGGPHAYKQYIAQNSRYPVSDAGITAGRVIVQFYVHADGSITDVEVARSMGLPEYDAEAVRLISEMPKWVWTSDPGKEAPMLYFVPVDFIVH